MYTRQIVFSQLMDFLPRYEFNNCVRRYRGHYRVRRFSCYDQFLCMAFAQLTYRESLRDIETCLRAMQPKLYQRRWQVELFFKWIKQHLRIKAFYGTSPNAVKTQIWIAISVYVLVAILKKQLKLKASLSEILQILSSAIFEKLPLFQLLTESDANICQQTSCNQLQLLDF